MHIGQELLQLKVMYAPWLRSLITIFRTYGTLLLVFCLVSVGSFSLGYLVGGYTPRVLGRSTYRALPLTPPDPTPDEPLRKYSIHNLETYPYQISTITVEQVLEKNADFTSYLFSYHTLGKKMTGQLNIPTGKPDQEFPVIVMVRGYVDSTEYSTGVGTRPVAAELAKAGYVTFAPDFLGFGGSDQAGPGWEERFEKPVNVIELIKSLRLHKKLTFKKETFSINPDKMGIWAHSNGGQITLTTLEALGEPLPTSLWAPVTAPFPYSILFFSKEMDDGGKSMRSALAGFEQIYNVQEYSPTQYIARLQGPLQLHQGTADEAVPKKWSDEFVQRVLKENERRKLKQAELQAEIDRETVLRRAALATHSAIVAPQLASASTQTATRAASAAILADAPLFPTAQVTTAITVEDLSLKPIELNYFVYKNASHFMRPGWEEAVARDVKFFDERVKNR